MLTVGVASSSIIVTTPLGSVLAVFPLVTVPFTLNVSFDSSITSSIIGTVKSTLVEPAGIVTVVVVLV